MADEKDKAAEKTAGKGTDKLILEACDAYGIEWQYVMASAIDPATGEAILVTFGGKKVRYKKGQQVQKLGAVEITGVNPDAKKRKPITGAAKK
ncbi:MAG TPA: hypothetical protein DGF30_11720 [Desulfomicrobium sp.]|nr:hypothetical protein [Desulfomicrobium sp.]